MSVETRARVVVELTLDVASDTWSPDHPMTQVIREAEEKAVALINRAFERRAFERDDIARTVQSMSIRCVDISMRIPGRHIKAPG